MVLLASLCALFAVQCTDPATPPTGFAVDADVDVTVTFNDGATTRVDARRPVVTTPPGACGWPVLVLVHGIGGNKGALATSGQFLAGQGYFTLAYDVRGHASATGLHTYFGARERWDVVELLRWAESTYAIEIDAARVGVSGASQGGIFAWDAAAWSGAALEASSGLGGSYPVIGAIVAENTSPDFEANFAPQGLGVHSASGAIILGTGVQFDAAFRAQVDTALRAEDWSAFHGLMTDPLRDPRSRVASITTPTMAMIAYDDFAFPARAAAQQWQALASGTPRKLYLGTGGHQSPTNTAENAFRANWRKQWFDHFLKGANNGIDGGPTITYAVTPNDTPTYLSATSTWTRKTANAWPPAGSVAYPMYLRAAQALSPFAPSGAESADTLQQTVAAGFDMDDVVNGSFQLALVETFIPRSTLHYDSAVLASALEFAGDARVHLAVSCPTTRYQVRASLWDVAPGGSARYVCGGSHFVFDDVPAGGHAFDVDLNSNAYVFAVGHRIRVQLENLQIHQPPTGSSLRFGPYVHPFTLSIEHSAGAVSRLELPVSGTMPIVYGTAQTNSLGCVPALSTSGVPSATSANAFTITALAVLNQKSGLFFYGYGIEDKPFHGGRLLVHAPLHRTPALASGGNPPPDDCSGQFALDFNARIQSGVDAALVPGARVFVQCWSRDPSGPSTTNLTDAVEFSIGP